MMQNVTQDEDHDSNKEIRTVEIEQGSPTGPSYPSPLDKTQPLPTSQSTFGQDISTSDDDEMSDVASYLAEQDIEDDVDDQDLEPSTFLLPTEGMEASNLPSIDPETHARLEALLEAAGIGKLSTADGKALTDPEVLRKLTSSVSCALDEAAQALHRMRAEQQGQLGVIEGSRSLAEACSDGDVPTVRKLLHEGGSVHETTEEGESLLSLACSAGYYELAQVLLAMKANVEDRGIKGDCTPLMEAASGGYVDIVKLLITHGADVNAQSSAGNTPLHYAACGGYEDVVQVLIDAGANVEQHNENGHTPLMESASAGHVGVARILLSSGAGINTHSNEFKESALTLACYKGHLEMVKFLLEAGADQEHKTDEMHTALMEASMDGHVEVARLLLDSGAQVNMPADSFESPLTLAACGGHVDLASLLIERGANLEEVNDEGYTPLMEAAREGHEEMVALLLAHGADINAQTEETQETALTLACCGGFLEVADFLIKAGADIELGCSTPLMEAAQEGHLELVRYLLKAGANVRAQTGTGDTALTYACENGHTDVAEVLLQHGADLEHESEGGRTPLMKAARAGHLCTVQFLISKGADVNRQTSTNDHTVLSLACAGGHLAVVELMLAHGGDPAHKLKDGSTMIIEAAKGGHTQVVKLLLEYPNRVLMNSSPDIAQQLTDPHLSEARVPVHGLANIVPPSDPDSTPSTNFTPNIQPATANKKQGEKDINIPVRTQEVWKNVQKNIGKRPHTGNGETVVKTSKSNIPLPPSSEVTTNNAQYQYGEIGSLPDLIPEETLDVKARERLEAIINNVMDKELDNTSTKEEQILRKQQILQELQKVERELQEKAQAQLLISAQHQREQQQQQQHLQQVLQQGAKVLQRTLEVQVKRKQEESPADGQSSEDQENQDVVEPSQGSNDLDKQVTSLFAPDGSTVGQIVFPNIPYDGLLPVTSSQTPQPGTEVVMEGNKEVWARNNGNVPVKRNGNKAGTRGNGAMKVSNTPTATTTTTTATSTSQVNGITNIDQGLQQPAAPGLQQTAGNGTNTLALYRQQIQNIQAVRQQQQQQQLSAPQVQQQHTQTIQFPQLQLTPEQQEQLLQMLSQQTLPGQPLAPQPLAQQQFLQQPALPQTGVQLLPPSQPQGAPQAGQAQQTQVVPSSAATAAALAQQQFLSQQQQQQLIQQQQQAQLLQQQLQQQIKPPQPAPPVVSVPKNARKQRTLYNTQSMLQPGGVVSPTAGTVENVTPPPSTPLTPNPSPASPQSISPLCAPIDLDAQTESNHDTALTLACHGGHSELVNLLLSKGADIEHRDKKGFTPLILAATAGHVDVVEILLDHGADMEAQSERTKDTPLSLACSGGRYEVVELLLGRGANKEHRNVSDYTPLSLAASGGYVNIIKLLLSHGAEINSRTGSKLGISPLMLAAMNGHTPAVKLLLDMGSDINAQIETNRNTALTLACFQGRHEVVSLLVDRKANIEHRAKTGLTPLMEAASGGYVEVGRVLLDKGADVNAPPVPSSRDTALTIAADKGHYRFVELLLLRGAAVDVKNKKGNSPLWLACNGGHLDVVQLLVSAKADIDSQDNRKVTCLMASFRKGHIKVVKWMVKHVNQFPSDQELARYISTVGDKELQKKCQQCKEIIVSAKDRQAAEANKNATILLEELDKERQHEENRKAAAAKKRERKKAKKREKQQEKEKETEDDCLVNSVDEGKNSSPEPECNSVEENPGSEDSNDVEEIVMEPPSATIVSTIGIALPTTNMEPKFSKVNRMKLATNNKVESGKVNTTESKKNKRNREKRERYPDVENVPIPMMSSGDITTTTTTITVRPSPGRTNNNRNSTATRKKKGERDQPLKNASTGIGDLDDFGTLPENMKISDRELERMKKSTGKVKPGSDAENKKHHHSHPMADKGNVEVSPSNLPVKTSPLVNSPKKGQKKEEGWKEVTRKKSSTAPDVKGPTGRDRSKKVQVPSAAISRVIGRAGCNINAIREVSGAHIEVEKQRGSGERVITIKGSADATRQAHTLISALVSDPDKDLQEIIPKLKLKSSSSSKDQSIYFNVDSATTALGTISNNIINPASQGLGTKSIGNWIPIRSQPGSVTSAGLTGVSNGVLRLSGVTMANPPTGGGIVWGNTPQQNNVSSPRRNQTKQSPGAAFPSPVGSGVDKTAMRQLFPSENKKGGGFGSPSQTLTNTTVTYSLASTSAAKVSTSASTFVVKSDGGKSSSGGKSSQGRQPGPGSIKVLQRPASQKQDPLPIVSNQQGPNQGLPVTSIDGHPVMPPNASGMPGFSPFNNAFSNVAEQVLGNKKDDVAERMNFASVAAAGVVSSMVNSNSPTPDMMKSDASLQAKAPGYRVSGSKPLTQQDLADPTNNPMFAGGFPQNLADLEAARTPGYRGNMPNQSPSMSPRSGSSTSGGLSPRGQHMMMDPSQLSMGSMSSLPSQKDEYSTPSQPMTLPKIESTLNPNAPNFTSRQPGQLNHQGPNVPNPNFPLGYIQSLYQQALAQQLIQQAAPGKPAPGGIGGPNPGIVPSNMISQQDFANLIHQFVASGQAQAPGGPPSVPGGPPPAAPVGIGVPGARPQNPPQRPFSPLPPQARPSSAPSMGGMPKEGPSPGPIGPPPSATSPMAATPPLQEQMKGDQERRLPRPVGAIGGERAQRRAPGAGVTPGGGGGPDYGKFWNLASELSMQWNHGSTSGITPVQGTPPTSSSVMNRSNMPSTQTSTHGEERVGPSPMQNHTDFMETRGDITESGMDKSLANQNMGSSMPFFGKVMDGGHFQPTSFSPGPVGDGMWNPQVKGQVPETSDKMWNSWSSQTSM
ncbi:ankyrin repeat and KH domain-containing protein 1-like isoform X1 [Argopecten irradians]|uniref:ankyrin repeat and KH domain-containing protein 1-like isoform X1 n=1 Tax=Argopecten irradians TaxID=31199 RepID=UPI0037102269